MRELVRSELAEPLRTPGLEIGSSAGPRVELVGSSLRIYTGLGAVATPLLGWLLSRKQGFGPCMRPDSSGSVAARTP